MISFLDELGGIFIPLIREDQTHIIKRINNEYTWFFNSDCTPSLDDCPSDSSSLIEQYIKTGNLNGVKTYTAHLKKQVVFLNAIFNLMKKHPKCFETGINNGMSSWYYDFALQNGKFGLSRKWNSIYFQKSKMLYYNRLLRDAEVRCLKHPIFKKK